MVSLELDSKELSLLEQTVNRNRNYLNGSNTGFTGCLFNSTCFANYYHNFQQRENVNFLIEQDLDQDGEEAVGFNVMTY